MSRFAIEPAIGTRRIRWYTLVALVLVPLLLAGVVIWAVDDYNSRLSSVTAAIVNDDDGTEIDGQQVPLGRQLTAGLVGAEGTADLGNYDWTLTDDEDAAAGLRDGRYAVVVTIPSDFSAKATSFSDAATAEQAVIDVQSSDRSRIADGVISTLITTTAADVFGGELSKQYLDGIYVGFNTLSDQLGTAADGGQELASGAQQSADGAAQLATGATGIASGTTQLADGLGQLASGTQQSADGAAQLSSGVSQYVDGAGSLATGLEQLNTGVNGGATPLPAAVQGLAAGTAGIAQGVQGIAALEAANPGMTLAELDAFLLSQNPQSGGLAGLAAGAQQVADGTAELSAGISGTADAPGLAAGIAAAASGAREFATQGQQLATGTSDLAVGLGTLASGTAQSASGAQELATGATTFSEGLNQFATGSTQLATGTTQLADGLDQAVQSLPTYSESDRETLGNVVTAPVTTETASVSTLVSRSALPLLISLALWIGALAVYLVVQAVSRRALTSRKSTVALALAGYLPGLAVGVIQGIAIAAIAQTTLKLDGGDFVALLGVAALTGASFAAVVQGVVALFGNVGRLLAALAAGVALAAGLISTAPALLLGLADLLPTAAASTAVSAIVTGSDGAGAAIGTLVVWGLIGFALSTIAVLRRRTVAVRQLSALPAA
ncbi:YhgE/Pip family protein [Herbiconiux sp. YIM B11900]|uniref:YhgE/Pip family protein n=1 Tax=Herbiconiux sp. YIM B11900 TaxID=3404131 RepID=UPI003F863C9B